MVVVKSQHGIAAEVLDAAHEVEPKCMHCCYLLASDRATQRVN